MKRSAGFQMIKTRKRTVKPLSPYSKDPQSTVHEPFIDYETGEMMRGSHYFKPLSKTILQYCEYQEYKYDGDIEPLTRRHIHADWILHIGKEANNIEEQALDGGIVQVFRNNERERERIIQMRQCDAERMGIDRKTRWRMKKCRKQEVAYDK
jgi:hypothetical protein